MMGARGYRFKKDLKASIGSPLQYVETSWFGNEFEPNGDNMVVGPDAHVKRDWYALVTCENGIITAVR